MIHAAPSPSEIPSPFRVGSWTVQADLNRLERGEESIPLEPRVMRVLLCLAVHPGEVWSREALLEAVWGDVVVQEEALTHAISRLRRAFGDDPRHAEYIETILKGGYRLIAPVAPLASGESAPVPATAPPSATPPLPAPAPPVPRIGLRVGVPVLLIVGTIALLWGVLPDADSKETPDRFLLEEAPLTSFPGEEISPAISPDGTRIAFAWEAERGDGLDLYVKQLGPSPPLQLTAGAAGERDPAWSPNGDRIAFARFDEEGSAVQVIPALGGPARTRFATPLANAIRGLDWDPRGERLVIALRAEAGASFTLHLLELSSGVVTPLLAGPGETGADFDPAFSPDGSRIAFARSDRIGFTNLHVVDRDGSEVRALTVGFDRIRGLDWTSGGDALVFSSGTAFAGEFRLWRLDVASGTRTWLATRGRRAVEPAVAAATGALVYGEETYRRHLARLPIPSPPDAAPEPFARSSFNDFDPHHSPSGAQVAFVSTRSGHPEVYVADRNGEQARAVTDFAGPTLEFVRWAPDERRIAYIVTTEERLAVHVTDLERGTTKSLTDATAKEVLLGWSLDGASLYLRALDETGWRTLRVSHDTGKAEEVFPFGAYMLAEAEGGEALWYVKPGTLGVMRATRDGNGETLLFEAPGMVLDCYWKASAEGFYFYRHDAAGFHLAYRDSATELTRDLLPIPPVPWRLLDAAFDGSSLLFDEVERVETDLMVVGRSDATR